MSKHVVESCSCENRKGSEENEKRKEEEKKGTQAQQRPEEGTQRKEGQTQGPERAQKNKTPWILKALRLFPKRKRKGKAQGPEEGSQEIRKEKSGRKAWRIKGFLQASSKGPGKGRTGREGPAVEIGEWVDLGGYTERIQSIRGRSIKILGTWIPRNQIKEK